MDNSVSFDNFTLNTTSSNNLLDCKDLTNNGLYMIFIGYVVPMFSPTLREYLKDAMVHFKNFGKVSGQIVSLTEFGFSKIQGINNNQEMIEFIGRVCKNKNIKVLPEQVIECAWSFSGDTDKDHSISKEESWNKLLKEIDRLHSANILQRSNHRIKP